MSSPDTALRFRADHVGYLGCQVSLDIPPQSPSEKLAEFHLPVSS